MSHSLESLQTLSKDDEKLQEIGSEIVRSAAKAIIEEKMGMKPSNPDTERKINTGEAVPADMLNAEGLKISKDGRALADWTESWFNIIIWQRSWSEESSPQETSISTRSDAFKDVKPETVLTTEEMEIARELNIDL